MRFTRFRNARLKPLSHRSKAGTEGFEPPARSDRTTAFKTAALNHSATYPKRGVPERTERSGTPLIIRTRPLKGTETRREQLQHLHGRASTGSGIRTRTTTILSRLPAFQNLFNPFRVDVLIPASRGASTGCPVWWLSSSTGISSG